MSSRTARWEKPFVSLSYQRSSVFISGSKDCAARWEEPFLSLGYQRSSVFISG
jgi:hypothetical protein